jgi:hypothetical protein
MRGCHAPVTQDCVNRKRRKAEMGELTAFRQRVLDTLPTNGQSLGTGQVCVRVFGETTGKRAGGAMEATTKALIYLCKAGLASNFQRGNGRFVYNYWFARSSEEKEG